MLKQITQFKVIVNDIESAFHFESSCPVTVAKEAVFACLKWLGQIEDAAKESKENSEQPKEVQPQEVQE
jgi:hypothetical protein